MVISKTLAITNEYFYNHFQKFTWFQNILNFFEIFKIVDNFLVFPTNLKIRSLIKNKLQNFPFRCFYKNVKSLA